MLRSQWWPWGTEGLIHYIMGVAPSCLYCNARWARRSHPRWRVHIQIMFQLLASQTLPGWPSSIRAEAFPRSLPHYKEALLHSSMSWSLQALSSLSSTIVALPFKLSEKIIHFRISMSWRCWLNLPVWLWLLTFSLSLVSHAALWVTLQHKFGYQCRWVQSSVVNFYCINYDNLRCSADSLPFDHLQSISRIGLLSSTEWRAEHAAISGSRFASGQCFLVYIVRFHWQKVA